MSFIGASVASVLALLAWLVSARYWPWVAFYSDFFAFLMLLVIAFCNREWRLSAPVIGVLVLASVPLLQHLSGVVIFRGDAILASVYLVGFAVSIAVGHGIARPDRFMDVAAFTLLSACLVSVFIALLQWLGLASSFYLSDLPFKGRPFANLGQPNNLATLLMMGLAGLLYLYERYRIGAMLAVVLAGLLIAGLVLTESRTPWVVGVVWWVIWAWKSVGTRTRASVLIMLAAVLSYYSFVMLFPYLADLLLLPISGVRESGQYRLELWWQLLQAVWYGPWWGYGWNQVSLAQVAITPLSPVSIFVEHSHNVVLDVLLWNGPILGGVVVVLSVAWLCLVTWRALSPMAVCALMAVGCVLIHGLLEFPLEYAYLLLPVGLLLGVLMAEEGAGGLHVSRAAVVGVCSLSAAVMLWVWQEYRLLEEDHRLMRFEAAGIGHAKSDRTAPDVVLFTQAREFIRYARTQAHVGMDPVLISWMGQVAHRYPYPPSLFRYALALALNERLEAADEQLLLIRGLHGDEHYREALEGLRGIQTKYPQIRQLQALQLGKPTS